MDTPILESEVKTATRTGASFAYPEGWFQVFYSEDIAAGQVVRLRYFGRDLALFRTETGIVQIVDAYCAHLGANLAVGGIVSGENIRCPFHAWEYGVSGKCVSVPYSDRIPPAAAVQAFPTAEQSGIIFLWYSPAGNAPFWELPVLSEFGDPAWAGYIKKRHIIRSTAREIVENIPDIAHGMYVHGNPVIPQVEFSFDKHKMTAILQNNLPSVGSATEHVVTFHGLGLAVNKAVGIGAKSFWNGYTPIDRETIEVNFSMLTARSTPTDPTGELSHKSALATVFEFEKDIPIWENKIYRDQPLLVRGDGPIGRFRMWSEQFYP